MELFTAGVSGNSKVYCWYFSCFCCATLCFQSSSSEVSDVVSGRQLLNGNGQDLCFVTYTKVKQRLCFFFGASQFLSTTLFAKIVHGFWWNFGDGLIMFFSGPVSFYQLHYSQKLCMGFDEILVMGWSWPKGGGRLDFFCGSLDTFVNYGWLFRILYHKR